MMIWLRRSLFSLLCCASIVAAIYFSFFPTEPNYAMTGVWLTFSVFMLAFGWPEVAESISFLGNNIKLREVKEAINELKPLAEIFSKSVLELMQGGSRWGGIPEEEKEKTYRDIERMLNSLSFTKEEIAQIQKRWHEWIELDYVQAIISPRANINHPEIPQEKQEQWHKIHAQLRKSCPNPMPEEIRKAFMNIGCYTPKIETALVDYESYKINKKHNDVERWRQRENWFGRSG